MSASSTVAESEICSVLDGGPADEPLLHALASALGFHAADLFVIADVSVPEDLAPLDREAGAEIDRLLHTMLALPVEQRLKIHRLIEQLPQVARPAVDHAKPPRSFDLETAGFGAMLLSLLCSNRNLHSPAAAATTVASLTHGHMYLSASTYMGIAHGHVRLRPEWVLHIATVLGIPAGDLAAITGIDIGDARVSDSSLAAEMAEMIWNLRRLSAPQARKVREQAESMLVIVPEDGPENRWTRLYHVRGIWWGTPKEHLAASDEPSYSDGRAAR